MAHSLDIAAVTNGLVAGGNQPKLDTDIVWQAKVDLAACFRMAAPHGLDEGICNHFSAMAPAYDDLFIGGFTVYRPDHWALAGTDLYYGDILGGAAKVLGYEVDGLDYTVRDGLPYPTFTDGAPEPIEIVAMGLAFNKEVMKGRRGEAAYCHDTTPPRVRRGIAVADIGDAAASEGLTTRLLARHRSEVDHEPAL